MVVEDIQFFHHFNKEKPSIIARKEPSKLTIRGLNLYVLVITIGNSSFNIKN